MHLYLVATEANLAKEIFLYIKEKTTTLSEKEVIQTKIQMTASQPRDMEPTTALITIDLKSWCNRFVYATTEHVFHAIAEWSGV